VVLVPVETSTRQKAVSVSQLARYRSVRVPRILAQNSMRARAINLTRHCMNGHEAKELCFTQSLRKMRGRRKSETASGRTNWHPIKYKLAQLNSIKALTSCAHCTVMTPACAWQLTMVRIEYVAQADELALNDFHSNGLIHFCW